MILGIDPGLANIGWAVVNEGILKGYGVIETRKENNRQIKQIYDELEKIIKEYKVTKLAYEKLYFSRNSISAMTVAEVIGVIKLCGMKNDIEVSGYTPLEVKLALTGYGRAEKEQVETMVRQELGLEKIISPSHAADAVAVALTDGFRMRI